MSCQQWVFRDRCGCTIGVVEDDASIDSADDAFEEFCEGLTDGAVAAIRRGVRAELVDHAVYVRDVMPAMLGGHVCPHGTAGIA